MSLRTRLSVVTGGAVAVAVLLLAVLVHLVERQDLLQRADGDLQCEAASLAVVLADGESPDVLLDGYRVRPYDLLVQVVGADGTVTPLGEGAHTLPVPDRALRLADGQGERFVFPAVLAGQDHRVLAVPSPDGVLMVARSMVDVEEHLAAFTRDLVLVVVAGVGAAVLLGGLVARAALRSLTRVSAAVADVAEGRTLQRRLHVDGQDEVARLSGAINEMLDNVEDVRRRHIQLVADASHELRTPLTSIRTNVEVMNDEHRLADADRKQLREDISSETSGLITAVDDLLELAREAPVHEAVDDIALDVLLEGVVEAARHRWPRLDFGCVVEPRIVTGSRTQLHRAFTNLVDNAAKWSPVGGRVEVTLAGDEVRVRDHGAGIPAAELPHVFERFYRATSARGLPGAGLGLAIVRKVVTDHGWQVHAATHPEGGAIFRVVLPDGAPPPAPRSDGHRRRPTSSLRPLVALAAATLTVAAIGAMFLTQDDRRGVDTPVPLVGLTGELARCGGQFCVGGELADFGPSWYVRDASAGYDYDGDGVVGPLEVELAGLVGTTVRLETDGGALDQDVYTVNGLPLRDLHGELPDPGPERSDEETVRAP